MRRQFSLPVVSVSLLSVLMGCDAYQKESNLSVSEKPALEADALERVSLEVFVSSEDRVSVQDREIDTNELRREIKELSTDDMDCSVILRVHPNARTGTIAQTLELIAEMGCDPKIERVSHDQSISD